MTGADALFYVQVACGLFCVALGLAMLVDDNVAEIKDKVEGAAFFTGGLLLLTMAWLQVIYETLGAA